METSKIAIISAWALLSTVEALGYAQDPPASPFQERSTATIRTLVPGLPSHGSEGTPRTDSARLIALTQATVGPSSPSVLITSLGLPPNT
jgi:hypothetical protein